MGVLGESASELSRELVDGVAKLRLSSLLLVGKVLPVFLEGEVKADLDGWFFVVPGVDTDLEFVPPGVMGAGFFPFMGINRTGSFTRSSVTSDFDGGQVGTICRYGSSRGRRHSRNSRLSTVAYQAY